VVKALLRVLQRREGRLKTGIILVVMGFFLPVWPLPWVTDYDYRALGFMGSMLRYPAFFQWGLIFVATGLCLILVAKATPQEQLKVKVIRVKARHIHLRITDGAGTREECYERWDRPCPFSEVEEEQ
jgi:hypothetical protein